VPQLFKISFFNKARLGVPVSFIFNLIPETAPLKHAPGVLHADVSAVVSETPALHVSIVQTEVSSQCCCSHIYIARHSRKLWCETALGLPASCSENFLSEIMAMACAREENASGGKSDSRVTRKFGDSIERVKAEKRE